MKKEIKNIIISILIPLGLGTIVGLITNGFGKYNDFVMPSLAPPKILFPIVWSILYTLMGISRYLIEEKGTFYEFKVYNLQLFVNLLWSFLFFNLKLYLFSFIWIILLIILVIIMIKRFYDISKFSAFLQIAYLIWLIFAAVLNFSVFLLN